MQKFKNLEPSELSVLAMEQAPRTVAPVAPVGKLQSDRVGNRHRILTNFVQLTVSHFTKHVIDFIMKLKNIL